MKINFIVEEKYVWKITDLLKKNMLIRIFWSPFETGVITKDPGNERFRMRSDSRKKIIEKYLKMRKLEYSYEK